MVGNLTWLKGILVWISVGQIQVRLGSTLPGARHLILSDPVEQFRQPLNWLTLFCVGTQGSCWNKKLFIAVYSKQGPSKRTR